MFLATVMFLSKDFWNNTDLSDMTFVFYHIQLTTN